MSLIWDLDVHRARARIGPGTTVLDLGASRGDFSIPAQHAGGLVLAVEPYAPNVAYLHERGVATAGVALGPYDGACHLHVPASTAEQPTGCFIDTSVVGECPMVSLATALDLVAATVDVVKCDTEGGEYEAFISVSEETLRRIRFAAIEFHVWTVDGEPRRDGIGHRGGPAMRYTPQQLHERLARTHDVELEGNYEAGGTMFCQLVEV